MLARFRLSFVAAALVAAAGLCVTSAQADYVSQGATAPPPTQVSTNTVSFTVPGLGSILTEGVIMTRESPQKLVGVPHSIDSFFDVFLELSTDGGQTWLPNSATGPSSSLYTNNGNGGTTTTSFDTEMISLDLQGSGSIGPFMLRESPTKQSLGQTSVTDIGGGDYRINSFFDVFLELSMDGGVSWVPADTAMHVTAVPEPASFALLAIGGLGVIGRIIRRKK